MPNVDDLARPIRLAQDSNPELRRALLADTLVDSQAHDEMVDLVRIAVERKAQQA